MRKTSLSAAIALSLAIAVPTGALAVDDFFKTRLNVPADQWMSPSQIAEKLGEKGYRVLEIESDDGAYEVEMVDKNGTRIEAHVHPATAELIYGYDD
jgi:Peptidase propeptide and YPEB domain